MKIIILNLFFFNTIFSQIDSCKSINHMGSEVFLLTKLNKISVDRLKGQVGGVINLNNIELINNADIYDYTKYINNIYEFNKKIYDKDYKIQLLPFKIYNKLYCEIIFQKNLKENCCYNNYLFSQLDGWDTFCFYLIDLETDEIIFNKCNSW